MAKSKTFGEVLRVLLDDSQYFNRAEWARFLCETQEQLEAWVSDESLPSPSILARILDLLRNSDGIPPTVLEQWEEISSLPIGHVVPCIRGRGAASQLSLFEEPPINKLGMYALWPRYWGMLLKLSLLTLADQEKFLDMVRDEILPNLVAKKK